MKLDEHTLRLVAVGASVAANCQPCLQTNVLKAQEEGIDGQEIADAIEVGKMVRRGAASKMDKFTANLSPAALLVATETGCGCVPSTSLA